MAAELSVEALRAEIDQIDEVIVRLLDSRARCAYAIGRVKHAEGKAVYEPAREAAVLAHVREVNRNLGGPLDDEARRRREIIVAVGVLVITQEDQAIDEVKGRLDRQHSGLRLNATGERSADRT